jgi:hypothetical protein
MPPLPTVVPTELAIERRILVIRDCKVMIDRDLAELYSVETRVVNQAVRRNPRRFPPDFAFQLTRDEFHDWRSQTVISNFGDRMGLRYRPWVFTEQGVAMLYGQAGFPHDGTRLFLYIGT